MRHFLTYFFVELAPSLLRPLACDEEHQIVSEAKAVEQAMKQSETSDAEKRALEEFLRSVFTDIAV